MPNREPVLSDAAKRAGLSGGVTATASADWPRLSVTVHCRCRRTHTLELKATGAPTGASCPCGVLLSARQAQSAFSRGSAGGESARVTIELDAVASGPLKEAKDAPRGKQAPPTPAAQRRGRAAKTAR